MRVLKTIIKHVTMFMFQARSKSETEDRSPKPQLSTIAESSILASYQSATSEESKRHSSTSQDSAHHSMTSQGSFGSNNSQTSGKADGDGRSQSVSRRSKIVRLL